MTHLGMKHDETTLALEPISEWLRSRWQQLFRNVSVFPLGPLKAVELDAERCAKLRTNLALLCPESQVICGDFCQLWRSLEPHDVIFLDIPWLVEARLLRCLHPVANSLPRGKVVRDIAYIEHNYCR